MDRTRSYKLISMALFLILILFTGLVIGHIRSDKMTPIEGLSSSDDTSKQALDLKKDIEGELKAGEVGNLDIEENRGTESRTIDGDKSTYGSITICIDPGHGTTEKHIMEPISPWSDEEKPGYAYGALGVASGVPEKDLVLGVSLKLRDRLEREGFKVVMTRETDQSDLTNIDRAEFGNNRNSDLVLRVHANGLDDQSVRGIMVLVPTEVNLRDSKVVSRSKLAGEMVLEEMLKVTGAKSLGIRERADITGFNWSKVPVILVEMGFMTNPEEDRLMNTPEYQEKLIEGMVNGVIRYVESSV